MLTRQCGMWSTRLATDSSMVSAIYTPADHITIYSADGDVDEK